MQLVWGARRWLRSSSTHHLVDATTCLHRSRKLAGPQANLGKMQPRARSLLHCPPQYPWPRLSDPPPTQPLSSKVQKTPPVLRDDKGRQPELPALPPAAGHRPWGHLLACPSSPWSRSTHLSRPECGPPCPHPQKVAAWLTQGATHGAGL